MSIEVLCFILCAIHDQALEELLENDEKFGFSIMDGSSTLFGQLCGNTRTGLHKISVELPKKHDHQCVSPVCDWRSEPITFAMLLNSQPGCSSFVMRYICLCCALVEVELTLLPSSCSQTCLDLFLLVQAETEPVWPL